MLLWKTLYDYWKQYLQFCMGDCVSAHTYIMYNMLPGL